jgi:hypothetical protein
LARAGAAIAAASPLLAACALVAGVGDDFGFGDASSDGGTGLDGEAPAADASGSPDASPEASVGLNGYPCRDPSPLLCLDFESTPSSPWAPYPVAAADRGNYFSLAQGPTGRAGHWDVPDPASSPSDAWAADVDPMISEAKGFTLELDLALVSMPTQATDATFAAVLGGNNGYGIQLVFSNGAVQVAEYQDAPGNFQEHPSRYKVLASQWVHVTLTAFGGGSSTSSLVVDGKTVETNEPLVEVPAGGVGAFGGMWLGEIHSGGQGGAPLEFSIDNVRLTSP